MTDTAARTNAAALAMMLMKHVGIHVERDGERFVARGIPGHEDVYGDTEGQAWCNAHHAALAASEKPA